VPALVERRDLDQAIALNSMTFNIARGIGPITAGAVVAAFGAQWAFGLNALTFLPLLVVLVFLDPRGDVSPAEQPSTALTDDVVEGVSWIKDRPGVLAVLVATLVVGWTSDPFSTLMPALAADLGGGDALVGLLVGSFGLGAALAAPNSERIRGWVGKERFVALGLAVVSVGILVVGLAPAAPIALVGSMISGSGFLLGVTGTNAALQRTLPERLRGRVMAWWSVAFLGCRPLAALFDGALADLTDVRVALFVSAAIAGIAGALFWRRGLSAATG
jgi:MFS family permease